MFYLNTKYYMARLKMKIFMCLFDILDALLELKYRMKFKWGYWLYRMEHKAYENYRKYHKQMCEVDKLYNFRIR